MDPIPMPDALDPDRDLSLRESASGDSASAAQLERARDALQRSCAYGQQLWRQLDEVRRYLYDDVAAEDSASLVHGTEQWTAWARVFADVYSTLAGPAGDSGAGESAARLKAREHGAEVPPLGSLPPGPE